MARWRFQRSRRYYNFWKLESSQGIWVLLLFLQIPWNYSIRTLAQIPLIPMPSAYTEISYEELGDYFGRKSVIRVDKEWLDLIMSETGGAKECSKCNSILPIDDFNADKRRRFGKRSQCKSCYKEMPSSIPKPQSLSAEEAPKIEYILTNFNNE